MLSRAFVRLVDFLPLPSLRVQRIFEKSIGSDQMTSLRLKVLPTDTSRIEEHGLLFLPGRYVVLGGRFNEMYGWDSYFIALGLLRQGRVAEGTGQYARLGTLALDGARDRRRRTRLLDLENDGCVREVFEDVGEGRDGFAGGSPLHRTQLLRAQRIQPARAAGGGRVA